MSTGSKEGFKKYIPRFFLNSSAIIPIVRLSGQIGQGAAFRPGLTLASTAKPLQKAFSIKKVPAVAIIVNSPGGSPVQSNLIYQRIRQLAEEKQKKVFVFVEDVAASGGYFIALAGDEIFADPSSIIGSIGVVSAGFGLHKALEKLGIERRVYTAGRSKMTLDPFQPEKQEDVAHLKKIQQEVHENFINIVKSRRAEALKVEEKTLFNGLFWAGKTALEMGLIDGLGDMRSILKQQYGDKTKFKLIEGDKGGLLRRFISNKSKNNFDKNHWSIVAEGLINTVEERALWSRYGL